jgi:hypothetical protein
MAQEVVATAGTGTGIIGTGEASTFHISWGAIFGGTFVALGLWILLHALGLAAGLTAIDPEDPSSLRSVGIGTGIWSIIAPLLALFCGAFVCARTAGVIDRGTGALHGAVLWGLTTVAGTVLVSMAIASVLSAGVRAGSVAVSGAARAAPAARAFEVNVDQALAPVNERLQQQGMPPVTSGQIQAAAQDVINQAVRRGRLDREAVVQAITNNTALDRADAEQIGAQVEQQFAQQAGELREGALQAAETTGKALWAVFLALLLGLISSVAGAMVGVTRRQRAATAIPVTPAPTPVRPVERQVPVETSP